MKTISFNASYGSETKLVEISLLQGGYYHLYVDRYYLAQIVCINDVWRVLPQNEEEFETADLMIIADIITENHQSI